MRKHVMAAKSMIYVSYTTLAVLETALTKGFMCALREHAGEKIDRIEVQLKEGRPMKRLFPSVPMRQYARRIVKVMGPEDRVYLSPKSLTALIKAYRATGVKKTGIESVNGYYEIGDNPNNVVASGCYDRISWRQPYKVLYASKHTVATFNASCDPCMWGYALPKLNDNQAIILGAGSETDREYVVEFPSKNAKDGYMLNRM